METVLNRACEDAVVRAATGAETLALLAVLLLTLAWGFAAGIRRRIL